MIPLQQQITQAFGRWLRTGWLPAARDADGVELKFNPYHDPRDGRFTFAPGHGGGSAPPASSQSQARLASPSARPPMGRGGNSRAMDRAMTLEQSIPGLRNAPGGAIIAVADGFFDFTGPAGEMMAAQLGLWRQRVAEDLRAIDPSWRDDRLVPTTIEGMQYELSQLRVKRAAAYLKFGNDPRPLQVETIRFIQRRTDAAYHAGLQLLRAGQLPVRLNYEEALGNFIDRQVRSDLRSWFSRLGIDSAGRGPVRVNRNEDERAGGDATYRRPDARIGRVAFDMTLQRKTLGSGQIRGFFNTEFRPDYVVIIRPRQIQAGGSYVITRQGVK